jgi:hypothetical protein
MLGSYNTALRHARTVISMIMHKCSCVSSLADVNYSRIQYIAEPVTSPPVLPATRVPVFSTRGLPAWRILCNHRKPTPTTCERARQARAKSVLQPLPPTESLPCLPPPPRNNSTKPPILPRARAPTFAYHCLSCCWPVEPLHPQDQIAIAS